MTPGIGICLLLTCAAGPVAPTTGTVNVPEVLRAAVTKELHDCARLRDRDFELLHVSPAYPEIYMATRPLSPCCAAGQYPEAIELTCFMVWVRRAVGHDGAFVDVREKWEFHPTPLNLMLTKRSGQRLNYWWGTSPKWTSEPYYGGAGSFWRSYFKRDEP